MFKPNRSTRLLRFRSETRRIRNITISERHPTNFINTQGTERVYKAYDILSNPYESFKYSVPKCLSVYESTNSCFLEEIFDHFRSNKDIFEFVCQKFWKSGSIRCIVLDNLIHILSQEKVQLVEDILDKLAESGVAPGFSVKQRKGEITLLDHMANQIIVLAAICGEPLVATSYMIQCKTSYQQNQVLIEEETIRTVLRCLCAYRGKRLVYYNYAVVRLVNSFYLYPYSAVDLAGIISLAISGSDDVYFANIIYGKLSNKITKNECSMDLSLALKDLILKNVELGHHETALEIWRNSKDLKYVFDDPDVHLSFLGNLNGHYADLFLREANLDESKREIVDALIRVVGSKDSELLECIMLKIGSPVRRSTLSALFEAFLKQRKDAESEKVLQSIFKTRTGLAPQDFSQIAKKVLEVNDVEKAIDMASSYHIKISGGGYVHIFEHILMNEEPQKYNAFFNTMVEKMKDADNDSRSLLFPILVRYLSIKYHVRLSRSFISSMVKNFHTSDSTPDISELPDLGKYSLTNDIYNVIYFSPSSFQKGLVVLLEEALKSKELDIVKWCITELRQEGFLVQEILSLIKNFNPSLFRELFHEDIENSIR